MLDTTRPDAATGSTTGSGTTIRANGDAPPASIPSGHVGPVFLPGSGRLVWWTGRVAIGLRHEPPPRHEAIGASALWVQDLMLQRAA